MSVIYDTLVGVSWQLDHFWKSLTDGDTKVGSGIGASASSFRNVVYSRRFPLVLFCLPDQSDKDLPLVPRIESMPLCG